MASLQRELSFGKICCPWRDQREFFINHLHNKYWIQPERSKPFDGHPRQKCANKPPSLSADPSLHPWNHISDPLSWRIYHTHCSDLLIPTCSLWDFSACWKIKCKHLVPPASNLSSLSSPAATAFCCCCSLTHWCCHEITLTWLKDSALYISKSVVLHQSNNSFVFFF